MGRTGSGECGQPRKVRSRSAVSSSPRRRPHPARESGNGGRGCRGDKGLVDTRVLLVGREDLEDLQLLGLQQLRGNALHRRVDAFQVAIEPVKRRHLKLLGVPVRPFRDGEAELIGGAVKAVERPDLLVDTRDALQREDRVLVAVRNQQRARGDQRGDFSIIPAVGVHHEHAVAMPLHRAVYDVVPQIGDPCDGDGAFDAVVQGGDPP